nr:hypothetical protein [Micromonospora chokoriensis]
MMFPDVGRATPAYAAEQIPTAACCSTNFSTRRFDTPSRYVVATTGTNACSARRQ